MGDISVRNLTKVYDTEEGRITAVSDLTLEVSDGEFLVMVGPSGCGKTTTLRCIAGLEQTTDGEILLDGQDVTHVGPADRNLAMVFQNYALYPHKTARDNMSFGLKLSDEFTDEEVKERVERVASLLDIVDLLHKYPSQLSGGQKQRVALGRAIVREPEAFLFDEPLSNLDAKLRTQMRTEIQQLQNQLETTAIYVTHDQVEAMTMGDRISVLDDGQLQQVGPPGALYNHPENQFVAGFIGDPSMNFVETTVTNADGQTRLTLGDHEFVVTGAVEDVIADHGEEALTAGVRPEHVRLVDEGDSVAENRTLLVEVKVVEPLGDYNMIYYDVGDAEFTTRVGGRVKPSVGETVEVTFDEADLYLFGADGDALKTREFEDTEVRTVQSS